MIPTAILAGLVVGRWWSVPIIGALWAVLVAVDVGGASASAFLLGAVNAAVGVGVHVLIRKLFSPSSAARG